MVFIGFDGFFNFVGNFQGFCPSVLLNGFDFNYKLNKKQANLFTIYDMRFTRRPGVDGGREWVRLPA
jgi:hypothetical protein